MPTIALFLATVNLKANWSKVWSSISKPLGPIMPVVGAIGVLLVVAAIGRWLWDRRRGGSGAGSHSALLWTTLVGALLCAPSFLLPVLLFVIDGVVNVGISLIQHG